MRYLKRSLRQFISDNIAVINDVIGHGRRYRCISDGGTGNITFTSRKVAAVALKVGLHRLIFT